MALIQTKTRNRMAHRTLEKIVYIRTNFVFRQNVSPDLFEDDEADQESEQSDDESRLVLQ